MNQPPNIYSAQKLLRRTSLLLANTVFLMINSMAKMRRVRNDLILLFTATGMFLFMFGCEEHGTVGSKLFDDHISLTMTITDTLSIETATVLMDSVITQGTGTILFGTYQDDFLGNVTANGYLKFSLGPDAFTPSQFARYTSLALRITPHYHYGNTSQVQQIRAYRVLEDIEPEEDLDALYNFSRFDHESQSLAEFMILPESDTELEITVSDQLGRVLFEAGQDGDDIVGNDMSFQEFFKGLVIKGDESTNTAIIGLISDESENVNELGEPTGTMLRLYYSDINADGTLTDTFYDFPLVADNSFTHLYSHKPYPLNELVQADDMLSSQKTSNHVFVQSGIGLMTRIDFDDLAIENLQNLSSDYTTLINASLTLFPIAGTYGYQTPLPQSLRLFVADSQNRVLGELDEQATAMEDDEFHRNTYYRFNITEFIDNEIQTERYTGNGLLLSTAPSSYNRTVDRVIFGDNKIQGFQMVLTITVIHFNI